jgi:hypothetical protein
LLKSYLTPCQNRGQTRREDRIRATPATSCERKIRPVNNKIGGANRHLGRIMPP